MKRQILLLAVLVSVLASCTTAYKTGQTPDDVYYSPARPQDEYVQTERKQERNYRNREDYYDDRYLRMRVNNRYRWSELDDWYYYGNRRDYSYYYSNNWSNPWSPCHYWNSYYNPYYSNYVIITPGKTNTYTGPRTSNLNTYNTQMLTKSNYSNPKQARNSSFTRIFTNTNTNNSNSSYQNSNSNRNRDAGSVLRNIFNGDRSSGSSSNSSSNSNSSSTNSSRSSSGSSGGGSAPVRRF